MREDQREGLKGARVELVYGEGPETDSALYTLERVMDLSENPIGMRIPGSSYCLCDPRFSHS